MFTIGQKDLPELGCFVGIKWRSGGALDVGRLRADLTRRGRFIALRFETGSLFDQGSRKLWVGG